MLTSVKVTRCELSEGPHRLLYFNLFYFTCCDELFIVYTREIHIRGLR